MATLPLEACEKVPFIDIGAQFTLADATWFEDEKTLFFFYHVAAEQGLDAESVIEVTWQTDDLRQPWTQLTAIAQVHTHLPIDCGPRELCGSGSVKVDRVPRNVGLRLRYRRDGALTRDSNLSLNVVATGAPHLSRSLLIYGVFDETNAHVQWRARHQFPALRNQEVQDLGLRRRFRITVPQYGDIGLSPADNLYGYGNAGQCSNSLTALGWDAVETNERARFDSHEMPLAASVANGLCATSTVSDATGEFTTTAVALKNPETHPAFPTLHNPVKQNNAIGLVLQPCSRTISADHLALQIQRLQLQGVPSFCTDNWNDPTFVPQLTGALRDRIEAVRAGGHDMVLALVLHQDDTTGMLAGRVEQALSLLLTPELAKSSPRVTGAFVFDSLGHSVKTAGLGKLVLWCPANTNVIDLDTISAASLQACPLLPDNPDITLGPIKFNSLPILPTRAQYETFLGKYSAAQAGSMLSIEYLAPEKTPLSRNVAVGDFGVATFFNNETISAAPADVFSFCDTGDARSSSVVFSIEGFDQVAPLSAIQSVHAAFPQPRYQVGVSWGSPFLIHLEYQTFTAGAVNVASFRLPFGFSATDKAYFGNSLWLSDDISLKDALTQCTRFCLEPTFDSGGVYNVNQAFDQTYSMQCYRPKFPVVGDGGFPLDP